MGCQTDDREIEGDQVAVYPLPPGRNEEGAARAGARRRPRAFRQRGGQAQIHQVNVHRTLPLGQGDDDVPNDYEYVMDAYILGCITDEVII